MKFFLYLLLHLETTFAVVFKIGQGIAFICMMLPWFSISKMDAIIGSNQNFDVIRYLSLEVHTFLSQELERGCTNSKIF